MHAGYLVLVLGRVAELGFLRLLPLFDSRDFRAFFRS